MEKILIVDDDPKIRENLVEILRDEGYETSEAESGKSAIDLVFRESFDLVLLDLVMPKMDGIDTLKEIKRINYKTRVIMITAFATIENAVEAMRRGADDYISKPFEIDRFLTTVKRTIEELKIEENIIALNLECTLDSLSNYIKRRIIEMLGAKLRVRLMELTKDLDIEDHTKVSFHLKQLKDAGILIQNSDKSYMLSDSGEKTLECLTILKKHLTTS